MRLRLAVVLGLTALCAVSCSTSKTDTQTATEAPDSMAAMTPVQRGAYLVTVTGCHDCHTPGTFYGTPDMSRQLSGSELGWQGPWGVSYARNLTPDATTGLGNWTDEEILNALQKGVRKDGSPMAPPMPWPDFAHLTHSDALAIVAYLRSIPPVPHQMPPRVPPGGHAGGSIITLPPPPEWDKPRG
jgi:mono/diheme cytochrome c family protein